MELGAHPPPPIPAWGMSGGTGSPEAMQAGNTVSAINAFSAVFGVALTMLAEIYTARTLDYQASGERRSTFCFCCLSLSLSLSLVLLHIIMFLCFFFGFLTLAFIVSVFGV